MFVGDAAAATDPMTGEGIGQALLTGRLAAAAVINSRDDGFGTVRAYERQVRADLVADDRMARALIVLLRRPRATRAAIRLAGSTAWTRRHFARWMFEDYPRAVVATPRRWHRGMFTGPGAFPRARRSDPTPSR
jgi:flavin-dependent dehydrogenase